MMTFSDTPPCASAFSPAMSIKNRAILGPHGVSNVGTHSSPHTFTSNDFSSADTSMPTSLQVQSISSDGLTMEFDLIGTCAPIANMIRRVMMEEVPTIAPEIVEFETNTSVLQDENLASRIGLVPIDADPKMFDFPQDQDWMTNPKVCIMFTLDVVGEYQNQPILSEKLQWKPIGSQEETFRGKEPPRPVHKDIVLVKLRQGQSLRANLYCCKGTAASHSKYSPSCPASYRMHPDVELCTPQGVPTRITGEEAEKVKKLCPKNVFDIEDGALVVSRTRECTMCRECVREEGRTDRIRLLRRKDHFIFTVESTGVYKAKDIVREALKLYQFKCQDLVQHVNETKALDASPMDIY
jgi:DNA-directed RNA polymerase I and III subunit RPAC1